MKSVEKVHPGLPTHLLRVLLSVMMLIASEVCATPDCHIQLSTPSVDFGRVSRTTMVATNVGFDLGVQDIGISLTCDEATQARLSFRGPPNDDLSFSWPGPSAANYSLVLHSAVLDGQKVELGRQAATEVVPSHMASRVAWRPGDIIVPMRNGMAAQGVLLTTRLEIRAALGGEAASLQDAAHWDTRGLIDAGVAEQALSIKAQIVPAACALMLDNHGELDLGGIPAQQLHPTKPTVLPERTLAMQVACEAPVRFAVRFRDDRQGSASPDDGERFGLGRDAHGQPLGSFRIGISPGDSRNTRGMSLPITTSDNGEGTWSIASHSKAWIHPGSLVGFARNEGDASGPSARNFVQSTLLIEPSISPSESLDIRQALSLDGHATLEVVYL